jgi:hypothetical protein
MFMAGLKLPFPEIVRELLLYLGVAPSQIVPNGWRYFFASFLLWKRVLGTPMRIEQFFNIYRPIESQDGCVEFQVRQSPLFIHLNQNKYSNNRFWKQEIFRVSGEWECPHNVVLSEDQRVPREWRPLEDDLKIHPDLSATQKDEIAKMIAYSADPANWVDEKSAGIDFDELVTDAALRQHFGYHIPENKVLLNKMGKPKQKKAADVPKNSATGGTSKKSSKAKRKASEKSAGRKDTIPGRMSKGASKKKKASKQPTQSRVPPRAVG